MFIKINCFTALLECVIGGQYAGPTLSFAAGTFLTFNCQNKAFSPNDTNTEWKNIQFHLQSNNEI